MDKANHTVSGVKCTVESCAYHCCDNACAAPGGISVGQSCGDCTCKTETLCSTYKHHG